MDHSTASSAIRLNVCLRCASLHAPHYGGCRLLRSLSLSIRHGRRPKTRVLQCSAESVCEESFAEAYERVLNKALQPIRDDLEAIEDTIGMTKDDLGTVKDDLGIVKDDLGAANV